MNRRLTVLLLASVSTGAALAQEDAPGHNQKYAREAEAVRAFATTPSANAWLDEAERLPAFEPRTIHYTRTRNGNTAYTAEQYEALDEADREGLRELTAEPGGRYDETFYGSPLAYLRALDLGAQHLGTEAESFGLEGARVFDLGYGQIGQLRMLARAGAHAVGADPDPILAALYAQPGDTGPVAREDGPDGSITLTHGVWPADESAREAVGEGFDLIIVRNLLKRGYIHPPQETPAYTQVSFGVPDGEFLGALFNALRPGGVLVIYTLGGPYAPPGESYNPSCDIANPWSEETWADVGFEVIAHEAPESEQARAVGAALGWGEQLDLDKGIFGITSIYRRPD